MMYFCLQFCQKCKNYFLVFECWWTCIIVCILALKFNDGAQMFSQTKLFLYERGYVPFIFNFAIVFALRALSITTGCFLMCDIKGGGSGGGIFSTKATITIVYNYIVYNCTACNSCPIMSESCN